MGSRRGRGGYLRRTVKTKMANAPIPAVMRGLGSGMLRGLTSAESRVGISDSLGADSEARRGAKRDPEAARRRRVFISR